MTSKSESKVSEGKDSKEIEEIVHFDLLPALIIFCESPEFSSKVEAFYRDKIDEFLEVSESKSPEENQKHEHYEIFEEYVALIESLISRFAQENDSNSASLFQNCRDVGERYNIIYYPVTANLIS